MMQELNYIRCGDYYIPDIRFPEKKTKSAVILTEYADNARL